MNSRQLVRTREKLAISQMRLSQISGVSRNRISLSDCGYIKLSKDELSLIQKAFKKLSDRDSQA